MIGWAFRLLAIWGGAGLLVYAMTGGQLWLLQPGPPAPAPSPAVAAAPPPRVGVANALVYHANQQGHVFVDAVVNGAPVRFMVDTGATFVALTPHDATAAGITRSDMRSNIALSTANGVAHAARVSLREVRLGQLAVDEVPAVVQDGLGISLLGQSFLTRLDSYEMRDGVLTLNWN